MSQSTEPSNTPSYAAEAQSLPAQTISKRHRPVLIAIQGDRLWERASEGRVELADALAAFAVNTGLFDGVAELQSLLWIAIQLRIEDDVPCRVAYAMDALGAIANAYATQCACVRDKGAKALDYTRLVGEEVVALQAGLIAQLERDRGPAVMPGDEGGAR